MFRGNQNGYMIIGDTLVVDATGFLICVCEGAVVIAKSIGSWSSHSGEIDRVHGEKGLVGAGLRHRVLEKGLAGVGLSHHVRMGFSP